MCGRYSISKKAREIGDHFSVTIPAAFEGELYNAAPTQLLPVIAMNQPDRLQHFRWGLQPPWESTSRTPPIVINARSESLHQKKMFSVLLPRKRCLIPADGFFEWEKLGKTKQPWRFVLKNDGLFAFAGLFDQLVQPDGSTAFAFTIVTTRANELLGGIHDRMPVILGKEESMAWLNEPETEKLNDLLVPFPSGEMESYKVSPKVNSAALNTPELIKPWQDPNLTLF
ncbi:MAG: SOS response-associated peptidase [Bacteroidales bacterium]|nr:SOS response-associated peptidase [Bacteroidales bacterium]